MERTIIDFLKMNDVEYKESIRLSTISPIRIGGCAEIVAYPNSEEQLASLICFLENEKIKHKILGRMSNVLPPDDGYDGVIIRTDKLCGLLLKENEITASSGVPLARISDFASKNQLSGMEELAGIPGSIGGAVVGNAGAFGREISDVITSVRLYDVDRKCIVALGPEECGFGYRHSRFKVDRYVIFSVTLSLTCSDPLIIRQRVEEFKQMRISTQPTDRPSLGSCFKRVNREASAALLIDKCGLKGKSFGGAMVSEKHAGFIVNYCGATASDYITLSDYVASRVYERYAIRLEREIEII